SSIQRSLVVIASCMVHLPPAETVCVGIGTQFLFVATSLDSENVSAKTSPNFAVQQRVLLERLARLHISLSRRHSQTTKDFLVHWRKSRYGAYGNWGGTEPGIVSSGL